MKKKLIFNKLFIVFLMMLITDFVSAQFISSNLPIVVITTDGGVNIVDEPKVPASIKIIDRGAGQTNFLTDLNNPAYLNYSGKIDIEFRGNSSQIPDKKPYGFDTMKTDFSDTEEVSLLGISKGDDWILNNLSFDPSMMHDFLAYNLTRKMGNYAVNTVYCEVVVNGDYKGLYILQEKPKRKRLGVSKIAVTDNSGINLTGGYLTEVDRADPGEQPAWTMDSYISGSQNLVHITPKSSEITPQQNAYIESVFRALESKATNPDINVGYPSIIDVPSFVDYMIVGELGSSCDVYSYSTKFHKDRGGKLAAGPVWDFNLGFGTDMLFNGAVPGRSVVDQWQFNNTDNQGPKFFKDLYDNSTYRCNMAKRFSQLSAPNKPLNVTYIHQFIDSTATIIQDATARDYARWGTEMPFKRKSFNEEIVYLKNFITQRSAWMTSTLGSFSACASSTVPNVVINEIMFSPKTSTNFTDADAQEFIELKNAGTTVVNLTGVYFKGVGLGYQFPPNTTLAPGQIIVLASDAATFEMKYGFAPFGQYALNLSNSTQTLTLSAPFGEIIDQVTYSDKAPWPNAKTNKKSLELINTTLDNAIGTNWFTSSTDEGSPGAENNFIPTPADNVTVSPTIATIVIGTAQQLSSTVLPVNATNKSVSWSSSDNSIATVNASGEVIGVGVGDAIITATTVDGGFTATTQVTVTPIQGITISVKRNDSSENPKIHVWSNETGSDIGITNSSNWPNNLPNMTVATNSWFTYTINKTQVGVLFRYTDKQTVDFKYYSKNIWILLDENGDMISITDAIPTTLKIATKKEIENVFTVIPNPVSSNFTVHYSTGSNSKSTLNIYSLSGQRLYTESAETEMFQKEFNAQELRLKSGVYIIQVQFSGGVDTKKIVVQ